MGGGGGDDGYAQKQAQQESAKQAARNAVNAQFGVAPVMPNAADFQVPNSRSSWSFSPLQGFAPTSVSEYNPGGKWLNGSDDPGTSTDPSTYGGAMSAYSQQVTDAAKNKTARDAVYSGIRDNAFNAGKRGLDEHRTDANRNLKFELFAKGLNGGSVDVDQNATLDRTYKQGVLDVGAKADAAKTDVRSSDEQTRLGLLQSIDAGMDQTSALSSALNQLQVNSDRAASQAQGTTVGDLFADAGLLYSNSQRRLGQQNAQSWWNSAYPSKSRGSSSAGSGGIITPTS